MCTVRRASKIIACLWFFGLAYCSPWLMLIGTRSIHMDDSTVIETCSFNLRRSHYATYYLADLLVFYIVPLFLNSILYIFIGKTLYDSGPRKNRRSTLKEETTMEMMTTMDGSSSAKVEYPSSPSSSSAAAATSTATVAAAATTRKQELKLWNKQQHGIKITSHVTFEIRNRIQVIKMLAVVVAMFASLWLPYRAYVVYNSFATFRFECTWCMLACRLMVYTNSAINPILYNAMSSKFRRSFLRLLFYRGKRSYVQEMQMKNRNTQIVAND